MLGSAGEVRTMDTFLYMDIPVLTDQQKLMFISPEQTLGAY